MAVTTLNVNVTQPSPVSVLTLTVPGPQGPAAAVSVGSTTTTEAGTSAEVTSTLDANGVNVFTFKIPRGAGVPLGGATGAVLSKASITDGDTTWVDATSDATANTVVKRDVNGWSKFTGVVASEVSITAATPGAADRAARKDYVDAQRDTRVAKAGDTMTGTLTLTGLNGLGIPAPGSAFNFAPGSTHALAAPFADLWHDLLAFNRGFGAPTYETSADGTTGWTAATVNNNLFARKEAQSIEVMDGVNIKGVRWTWSGVEWSSLTWLIIGYAFANPNSTREITVETFDGTSWIQRHQSQSSANAVPVWHYASDGHVGHTKLRLTIRHVSGGAVKLSSIRYLSSRWGDQGDGSELEFPYTWDADRFVTFVRAKSSSASPSTADELTRKDYVDALGTAAATASTIMRRDSTGYTAVAGVTASNAPTSVGHLTRKDYVDAQDTQFAATAQTADYTLALTDAGTVVEMNAATPTTVTVPANASVAFPIGTWVEVERWTAQAVTIAAATGVSLNAPDGDLTLRASKSRVRLHKVAVDTWVLSGDNNDVTAQTVSAASETATANTLVKRSGGGSAGFGNVDVSNAPTQPQHATRKSYVDEIRRTSPSQVTAAYTLALTDEGKLLYVNNGTGTVTVTIPASASVAFPVGAFVDVIRWNAGEVNIAGETGVAIVSPDSNLTLRVRYSKVRLRKTGSDTWAVEGDNNDATAQAVTAATNAATANAIVRRDANTNFNAGRIYLTSASPSATSEVTRKDYVDNQDTLFRRVAVEALNVDTGTTLAHEGKVLTNAAAAGGVIYTIQPNGTVAFPIGGFIDVMRDGAQALTVTAATGVTLTFQAASSAARSLSLHRWQVLRLYKVGTDSWYAYDLTGGPASTTWQDAVYENGWSTYNTDYANARYRILSNNQVEVQGLIKGGSIGANIAAFTLPVGLRPNRKHLTAQIGNNAAARVDFQQDGKVCVVVGSATFTSVNYTFYADQ